MVAFICSMIPFKGLALIKEVTEILIHKRYNTKNVLNTTNSADPDEMPHFVASHLDLRYL